MLLTSSAATLSLLLTTQVAIPRVSPAASVAQTVGTTEIRIDYHRPAVRGRVIWGGLVPYAEVWRLGANNATRITFGDPVQISGQPVPAGTYALFAIPERDRWTFVLNQDAEQWGSLSYDAAKDQLRVDATPRPGPFSEHLEFTIDPVGTDGADVIVRWEHLAVSLPVRVDVGGIVWSGLDAALAASPDDQQLLGRIARFSAESGERLEQGLAAIERLMAKDPSHWNLDMKAKLLWQIGRESQAIRTMEAALEAGKGKAPDEFFRTRGAVLAGWRGRSNN